MHSVRRSVKGNANDRRSLAPAPRPRDDSRVLTTSRFLTAVALAPLAAGCRAASAPAVEPLSLPFTVDTLRTSEPRDGVVHRFIYSAAGPWAIHVLEARADRCWSLAGLKSSGGATGRQPTSELVRTAAAREDVAGGVNADFFLFTPPGVPVGLLVADGRLIAGPIAQPALAADSAGRVHIGRFETAGHVTVNNGRVELTGWNRNAPNGVAFFDPAWGSATDTATGVLEIVLDDSPAYRVAMIDTMPAGVGIPATGAVLRVGRNAPASLRNRMLAVPLGSPVTVVVALRPFHPREAVGGRPMLVRAGAIAAHLDSVGRSGFATSRHPRTAAGISRDGSRVYLVTVDGRQAPYSDGMRLDELASLMLALGSHEAVNLDGGGSTAMVVAEGDTAFRVVNRPSDRAGERAVGDAVGLVRRCTTAVAP
jgi:hypothetical protein